MSHPSPHHLDPDGTPRATPPAGAEVRALALQDAAGGSVHADGERASAVRIASAGHAAFAATLTALGILGAIKGNFTPIWLPVPRGMPAREGLVYLSALISLACGLGLIWRRAAAVASGVLLGFLLAWLLLLDTALLILHPGMQIGWAAGKTAARVAAAWVLYVRLARRREGSRLGFASGGVALRMAQALYGLALIPFGVAHFTYLARTISMVPAWLPWHTAWAYFFGGTFIAAGIALLSGVYARLAAILSVVQLGLFTLLVWVPVVATGASASDWSEFVVSWALTAAAWVVADSYGAGAGAGRAPQA